MTEQEIIEGNVLIAIFDGAIIDKGFYDVEGVNRCGYEDSLDYHKDWNWLMAVVYKIHDQCKYEKYTKGLKFFKGLTIFSTIEQVWQSVVDSIQFYNNKNKK